MSDETTINQQDARLHQVSFIHDKNLYQVDFMSVPSEAHALDAKLEELIGNKVSDLRVYEPRLVSSSAEDTLNDVIVASPFEGSSDPDVLTILAAAVNAARRIDALVEETGTTGARTLEFVWHNGGSDENAFGQDVAVPAGPAAKEACEKFMESIDALAYDLDIKQVTFEDRSLLIPLDNAEEAFTNVCSWLAIPVDTPISRPGP